MESHAVPTGREKVFIGIPLYTDAAANAFTVKTACLENGLFGKYPFSVEPEGSSLLPNTFNTLWCKALAGGFDYFIMLHADIVPEAGFALKMLDLLKKHSADLLSVVAPIKNDRNLYSCGIADPRNRYAPMYRFTGAQLKNLPPTFSSADTDYPDYPLLWNTGLFIADMRKQWVRHQSVPGVYTFHFDFRCRIKDNDDGAANPEIEPEDWYASKILHELGGKAVLTREVVLNHMGRGVWNNQSDNGIQLDFLATRPHVDAKNVHPNGFWLDDTDAFDRFDPSLAEAIADLEWDRTVADFGCGRGKYVAALRDRGVVSCGFDGNPHTSTIPNCSRMDLSERFNGRPHQTVLSLEVGEHIPPGKMGVFLDNIASHAEERVILSWAVPGQPGRGHVNCRDNECIIDEMARRGWKHDPELSDRLRASATQKFFKDTLMVFGK